MRSTDQLDAFNLQRFIQAQDPVFDRVQAELDAGRKRSHWMWFIFPQFAGLGGSEMSRRFAIRSAAEAQAYLDHPLLGARLRTCTQLVLNIQQRSIGGDFRPSRRPEISLLDDPVRPGRRRRQPVPSSPEPVLPRHSR